jgi:predicted nucleic acid-binding protein
VGMAVVSDIVDKIPYISVISQIEVLRFNAPAHAMKVLSDFVDSSIILSLDDNIVKVTIDFCRQSKIKLPDAIIAATALVHNQTLLTRNVNDFKNISKLIFMNPWEL